MMRAVLVVISLLRLFPLSKFTTAVQLDVNVYGTPGSGFLMKPFYPVLNDTSLQEWPLVVLPGLHSVAATYGPFSARSDSVASKLFTSDTGHSEIFGVQYVGNYAISAHLSTDVLTILQPRLQVVFHMDHMTDDALSGQPGDDFQQVRQLCAVTFIHRGSEELMSTCVMDVTSPETLCVASAVLPYHWWHPTLNRSVSVYYSVFNVAQDHQCTAAGRASSVKVKTYEWFADSAREKQSYVGPVNLSASLANYEELREDQHLLIYVPTTAVSSRSVFHVPMKLQAASDLQIFVIRMKCRNGLRILGAEVSGSSSWQITVDVNEKRRSATLTASTPAVDADKAAHSVQELFSWLIEVDGSVEDGDRGRIVFTLEYEMTRSRKEVYSPVRNKAVAFVTFRDDSTLAVLPIIKTTELVNTAVLSEHIVSWPMHVFLLTHTGRASDITLQSSCQSQDERVLKVSVTCDLVYFDGTEARGASNVGVIVKHGPNVRTVNFRVWIPELPLDVVLSDTILNVITGWKVASPPARVGVRTATKDQDGTTTSDCSNLRFQSSLVDVYARFVYANNQDTGSYLLHRKAQFLVTDVVRSLLQVADNTVARLRDDYVIDGVKPGQTSVQVVQKSGRVIGSCELIVDSDRVDVSRLDVAVVSGLSLSVSTKTDFPGALSVHVAKTNLMHHRYQEALLDLTLWFDDGTSLPLRAVSDSDYSLLVETLDKDIVELAPPRLSRLVTISAVSPGSGDLVHVSLGIDTRCSAVKRWPLVAGFAFVKVEFDEMVQSDASYYHSHTGHDHFDPDLYTGPFLVSRDRVIYSRPDRSRKGRRRNKGKGRSGLGRGKSSSVDGGRGTTDSLSGIVPRVEAQQQRQEPVIEAPRKSTSSLELAMYVLLAVFSVSVIIFAANCLLFLVRRGHKQKLADPKERVLEAKDWVWIGPATLERNDVITSCGRRLMSDAEFSSNQSSRPNSASFALPSSASGSNRNSTVSTYRGSECSVRITTNPLADDNGNIVDMEPVPPLHPEEYFLDEGRIVHDSAAAVADDDDDEANNIDETDDEEMRSTDHEMTPRRSNRFIRPLSSAWSTMSREEQLRELEEAVASGLSSDWDCEGFGMTYAELMEYFDNLRESTA